MTTSARISLPAAPVLLCLGVVASAACSLADVELADDVVITCTTRTDCPARFTACNVRVGRCVDGRDVEAPRLVTPVLSRASVGQGSEVALTFGVDEELFVEPVVSLGRGARFVREPAGSDDQNHRYTYVPTAADVAGDDVVVVELVDPFGNERSATAGTLTLDFTPPAVVAATVDDPLVGQDEIVTLAVTTSEALASAPEAFLVRAATTEQRLPLSLVDGGAGDTAFVFAWTDGANELDDTDYRLVLELVDEGGNASVVEPGVLVRFDAAPPRVLAVEGPVVRDPTGLPVRDARSGAVVELALEFDADVEGTPEVSAGDRPMIAVAQSEQRFTYALTIDDAVPDGALPLTVRVVDRAGNAARIEVDFFVAIDHGVPAVPTVDVENAVVLRRLAGDGSASRPDRVQIEGAPGSAEPGAQVVVLARPLDAAELEDDARFVDALDDAGVGTAIVAEAGSFRVERSLLDLREAFVLVLDPAGNRSPTVRVVDVEWTGAPGAAAAGPRLLAVARFDGNPTPAPSSVVDVSAHFDGHTVAAAGRWERLPDDVGPAPRKDAGVAVDAERGVAVIFGGLAPGGGCDGADGTYCGDTWEWSGTTFRRVLPIDPEEDGDPTPRFGHVLVGDPLRARTLLFGGKDSSGECDGGNTVFCGGTWSWDGASWRRLVDGDESTPPSARLEAAAAWDLGRDRWVVFGGTAEPGSCFGGSVCRDTFEFDGERWAEVPVDVTALPPSSRSAAAMAWDEERGVIVLFGGRLNDGQGTASDETWEFDGRWQRVVVDSARRPPARFGHGMTFDPVHHGVVVVGGEVSAGTCGASATRVCSDAWVFDGTGWTLLATTQAPSPRTGGDALYSEPLGGLTTMFGLTDGPVALNDVWTWSGSLWRRRAPSDPEQDGNPPTRLTEGLAIDPDTGRLVGLGGPCIDGPCRDMWRFDDASWAKLPAEAPSGPPGALVPLGGDVWRLGDLTASHTAGAPGAFSFDDGTWTPVLLAGDLAGPRSRYAAAHDPVRDVVVVFGGLAAPEGADGSGSCPENTGVHPAGAGCASASTFEIDADGTVRRIATATAPPVRLDAAMAYDEESGAIVLFGGQRCGASAQQGQNCDGIDEFEMLGDTWLYDAGQWRPVVDDDPPLPAPRARAGHALAFDSGRRRVVLFGGTVAALTDCGTGSRFCRDLWEWTGHSWEEQEPVIGSEGTPRARAATGFAGDVRGGGVLLVGGSPDDGATWRWSGGADTVPAHLVTLSLAQIGIDAAATMRALHLHTRSAGHAEGEDGARLLVWQRGRFNELGAHRASLDDESAALDWSTSDPTELFEVLGDPNMRRLVAAVSTRGPGGTGPRAALRTDAVEVTVRYRLSSSAAP
jgi:hypothetical protein